MGGATSWREPEITSHREAMPADDGNRGMRARSVSVGVHVEQLLVWSDLSIVDGWCLCYVTQDSPLSRAYLVYLREFSRFRDTRMSSRRSLDLVQ